MELEFDKEINAIVRKARDSETVGVATASPHVDADTIAAFAENLLPEPTKLFYTQHFADCDNCRRQLSQTILMNNEADAAAASSVLPSIPEPVVPWYQKILKLPNLALAMGALVVLFGGFLGYQVFQNGGSRNADVAKVEEPKSAKQEPYFGSSSNSAAANSSANTAVSAANSAMPAANASAERPEGQPGIVANTPSGPYSDRDAAENRPASTDDAANSGTGTGKLDEAPKPAPLPLVSSAKPADHPEQPVKSETEEKDKKEVAADSVVAGKRESEPSSRKQSEDRRGREDPTLSKNRSGPAQNQTQMNNGGVYDMTVNRSAGGKTFQNRNGAWYDSTYHGQATTNVSRGTDAYKKLDGGLRKIAEKIGGTVIVVWKDEAYRIQ